MYVKGKNMATTRIEYLGDLRTKCIHEKSGVELITDAPTDNNGLGESFSPTDLIATAYGSCMLTIIGIYCKNNNIDFKFAHAEVLKVMGSGPRRVDKLIIQIDFSGNDWDESTREKIVIAGENCPVAKSVNDSIQVEFTYQF